ncbi:MAG: hypothetical protein Q9225_007136 [Loekoesia sp. 1 TL-2023]
MHSLAHILTAAGLFTTITASLQARPQKVLSTSSPSSQPAAFGVGFDLTASYGSAAISFSNGTTITLPAIPAEEERYNQVLHNLSLDSSKHPSPPYNNVGESWDDMPRQYLRKARKAIGLPASSDVGALATMLSRLRAGVEEKVGPITSAGVTTMNLVALYDEDLHDAFEYVGLDYITFPVGYVGHNILYETSAAYAGYGYGLCRSADYRTDPEACKQEQYNMTDEVVMAVLYTDIVLSVSLSVIRSAYALWEPPYRYLADFDLGYKSNPGMNPEKEYWRAVEQKLQQIMIDNPNYERPSKVLLMGDRIEEPGFKETLVKALSEQMKEEMPEILGEGAVGVAARGTAEMAKRESYISSQARIRSKKEHYYNGNRIQ